MRIRTLTLNPSVDIFEGIHAPGGKGVNVARALAGLGVDALAYTFADERFSQLLTAYDVPAVTAPARLVRRTHVSPDDTITHNPRYSESSTRAYEDLCTRLVRDTREEDIVVLAGSVPPALPASAYADLTRLLPCRVLVDTSTPEAIQYAAQAGPWMLKMNEPESYASGVRGVRNLLITRGAQGLTLDGVGGRHVVRVPRVQVIHTVGCGDAVTAGMLAYDVLAPDPNLVDSLRHGAAAGTDAARRPGLCTRAGIDELLPQVRYEFMPGGKKL